MGQNPKLEMEKQQNKNSKDILEMKSNALIFLIGEYVVQIGPTLTRDTELKMKRKEGREVGGTEGGGE